jgi:predicted amidohydrolase
MSTTMARSARFGLVLSVVLGSVLAACAAESSDPLAAKQQGKTGSRVVGVSCICRMIGTDLSAMERWIDQAALDKPDLILLTEGSLLNVPSSAPAEEQAAKADPLPTPGPITEMLARKAKQYHTYILGCYYRKDPNGRGRYNSAVLIDREGRVAGWYDKTFPTIGEMEGGVLPGRGAVVFDTDFGRIGALICFDLNFPELLAEYKSKGVDLLCFLSMFRGGRMIPAIALGNQCFFASAVPDENGVIVDPLGRTLAESSQYGRIIFARLNLDSRIVHIDYNESHVARMKEKYGPQVQVITASPEAVYWLSSLHPDKSIEDMIQEFQIEVRDDYLDRARAVRQKYLPKDD